ncbi:hypothetical protein QN372_00170 [Undibacterium sp. RTI2.1]|uniref:hypothetical protein n=1 Tax=unclassified Undibacterium TaxID=2630295 RepID=UPI002AB476B4|nr:MULTISPECIES: hypothetical protein [unclassified Undibacterium]MDY7537556.1 hypothetical protein [Undibacterium sp. 5I1]MEB0029153.1 hypothetical protein [Undibacterium sp. RTI2.1]MEB0115461.1 hypothetical protein [Undibacterium sp. RTI2.2]MEB0231941.1 hypothetical protein [Undibacterium sp. 10I3]MEB0256292.1 hypothetical protein [Undibacterium sp. 5I1]
MAKVTMHKANDGTLFDKAKDCEAHNYKLRLTPIVKEFAEGLTSDNNSGVCEADHGGLAVFVYNLPEFICHNADKIRSMLANASVVRKPRKPAKQIVTQTVVA